MTKKEREKLAKEYAELMHKKHMLQQKMQDKQEELNILKKEVELAKANAMRRK